MPANRRNNTHALYESSHDDVVYVNYCIERSFLSHRYDHVVSSTLATLLPLFLRWRKLDGVHWREALSPSYTTKLNTDVKIDLQSLPGLVRRSGQARSDGM